MPDNPVDALLRFLSKDAKLPLPKAISYASSLNSNNLASVDDLAKSKQEVLLPIVKDAVHTKQILAAAKRVSKSGPSSSTRASRKRTIDDTFILPDTEIKDETNDAPSKKRQHLSSSEVDFTLPSCTDSRETLSGITLSSNRAPYLLAFAFSLMKYTLPAQDIASRLSIAQAVTSLNAVSKARSIGLASKKDGDAGEEGDKWGGRSVKVMGREIRVLVRHDGTAEDEGEKLFALDLGKMKNVQGVSNTGELPIYEPKPAREYLLKSFTLAENSKSDATNDKDGHDKDTKSSPSKAKSQKAKKESAAEAKASNLAQLLRAIDLVIGSWAGKVDRSELDSKAWNWYVQTRPEVAAGQSGWGQKGRIELQKILDLGR